MDTKVADIDGDGSRETIYFGGKKSDPNLPSPDQKRLIVRDGEQNLTVDVPGRDVYYGTSFQLRDLTGDRQPEFLLFNHVGGSGGIIELNVYSLRQGSLVPLFKAAEHYAVPGLSNKYLGEGRVRVSIPPQGLAWEFVVPNYGRDGGSGGMTDDEVESQFSPDWVDPFSGYDLVDLDADGKVEIVGHQRVCGVAHVDAIADLRQVFAWDGSRFSRTGIELHSTWSSERLPVKR